MKKNMLEFRRKTFTVYVCPQAVYSTQLVVLSIYIRLHTFIGLPKTSAVQVRQHCRPKAREGPNGSEEGGEKP